MSRPARIALALLIVALSSACTLGREASPPARVWSSRHVLPNGVRVVIEEDRRSDVVALQLWVRAGGRDETAGELGLAHYLEHLLFRGTTSRPAGYLDREVESVGGRMNAGTSLDYTHYHMLLPATRALAGIKTLADISVNSSLDQTQLEREKRVVFEEIRRGEDNPMRYLVRQLYAAAFDGHPYGRPVLGTPDLISTLNRDGLVAFYRRHYVPEAFALVVVGAVGRAEVLEAAAQTFGRLPRSGANRSPAPPLGQARPRRLELARPGAHAYLGMAWHAPRLEHADTPAVDLLVTILGQGRDSRLTRSVRERLGLVNSITSSYAPLEMGGLITLTAQLEPPNLTRAEDEVWREVHRLQDHGVTAAELERARTVAEARREFQAETVEGRAFVLGHAETVWRLEGERAYADRLRAVSREQVQAAARRYLDRERFARVLLMPGDHR